MQGFNINQVEAPPTVVPGQILPPTGGGGWGANCQPGIDGSTPDADMFNDLLGNILRVCQAGNVVPTPNRYDDLLQAIARLISLSAGDVHESLAGSLVPTGAYLPFAGSIIPAGFLLANGAAVSRTSYSDLFAIVGTTYGAGDGASTFNLPDTRGVGIRGFDNGRGLDPGRTLGSYQADTYASHDHGISDPGHAHSVSDPGHGHGVNDPGHQHSIVLGNMAAANSGPGGAAAQYGTNGNNNWGPGASVAATGIGINGSGTGIGIYGSGAGISIQGSGGAETRGKNLAANFIIKF